MPRFKKICPPYANTAVPASIHASCHVGHSHVTPSVHLARKSSGTLHTSNQGRV